MEKNEWISAKRLRRASVGQGLPDTILGMVKGYERQ